MHARVTLSALLLPLATVLGAAPATAQIITLPTRTTQPRLWVQASAGMLQVGDVADGRTGTEWRFSDGIQYRGALEYDLRRGSAIGVAISHAPKVDMSYVDPGGCDRCDGSAAITSVTGLFRAGGNAFGLHQVLEVQVGVARYHTFELEDPTATPAPDGDTDLSFGIGYGLGYSLSPRWQIALVQDVSQVLHQRDGLEGGASRNVGHYATRIGLRYGFAMRRPGL